MRAAGAARPRSRRSCCRRPRASGAAVRRCRPAPRAAGRRARRDRSTWPARRGGSSRGRRPARTPRCGPPAWRRRARPRPRSPGPGPGPSSAPAAGTPPRTTAGGRPPAGRRHPRARAPARRAGAPVPPGPRARPGGRALRPVGRGGAAVAGGRRAGPREAARLPTAPVVEASREPWAAGDPGLLQHLGSASRCSGHRPGVRGRRTKVGGSSATATGAASGTVPAWQPVGGARDGVLQSGQHVGEGRGLRSTSRRGRRWPSAPGRGSGRPRWARSPGRRAGVPGPGTRGTGRAGTVVGGVPYLVRLLACPQGSPVARSGTHRAPDRRPGRP